MDTKTKNIITIGVIILVTAAVMFGLTLIPNYLKPLDGDRLPLTIKWISIFLIADVILIGIFAAIHKIYVNDYSRIKSIWFFAIFGGITGAMLGEGGNFVMILPYTIIMLIYAFFYKKFTWWKVALTSFLGGVVIENVINRSPLQSPTLLWVAFLVYPYFATKIWENRGKVSIWAIVKDFKFSFLFAVILGVLAYFVSIENVSPPLIFLGIVLPFIVSVVWKLKKKWKENSKD